ncbi:plasmid replication initiation protein [Hasllibacter halocynthiae]|uniref:Plasmid replication initiation protein n=1 Tax=Hasllibacter halocynthiae TaxID=595589 RepID=A0A2T0WZ10_9RHOB|nr:replication initiator protein A [Hasllibacter halocynthiae]PRY91928.1 plasmid replication initiation protein [Hasllibacter halocynthiae]
MGSRLPDRHPNRDFFILDVTDAAPKDDMASMEHPVFSLSSRPDMRELEYEHGGQRLRVVPSGKGLATILDKDILLYCISKLVHDLNRGADVGPTIEMTAHEVMVGTNWRTTAASYQRFEDALVRLRGTTIVTDIRTGEHVQTRGFGLIEAFEIDRRDERGDLSPFGRMTKVRITVSDWTLRAVKGMEVLSISADYFRLRRPLERRIYELARKHVGEQDRPFAIRVDKLQKKVGSNSPLKKFRFFLREIIEDGHVPDYDLALDGDIVVMSRRDARARSHPRARGGGRRGGGGDGGGDGGRLPLFEASLDVSEAAMARARAAAPGYDVHALRAEWRAFAAASGTLPKDPDAAFVGFCRRRHERAPVR